MNLPDISSRNDIDIIIREFYGKIQQDPVIGEKFDNLDFEHHIPLIVEFWNSIIFGSNSYQGDPFSKHIPLELSALDFTRWLAIFSETIDQHYLGQLAEEMKNRAASIAKIFMFKLGLK